MDPNIFANSEYWAQIVKTSFCKRCLNPDYRIPFLKYTEAEHEKAAKPMNNGLTLRK